MLEYFYSGAVFQREMTQGQVTGNYDRKKQDVYLLTSLSGYSLNGIKMIQIPKSSDIVAVEQ
jgi:hypothetical protein